MWLFDWQMIFIDIQSYNVFVLIYLTSYQVTLLVLLYWTHILVSITDCLCKLIELLIHIFTNYSSASIKNIKLILWYSYCLLNVVGSTCWCCKKVPGGPSPLKSYADTKWGQRETWETDSSLQSGRI